MYQQNNAELYNRRSLLSEGQGNKSKKKEEAVRDAEKKKLRSTIPTSTVSHKF